MPAVVEASQAYYGETLAHEGRLFVNSITLTNTDLTAVGTTQTFAMGTVPANAVIAFTRVKLTDAFDSSGSATLNMVLGDGSNDDNSILAATDLYTSSAFEGVGWTPGVQGVAPVGPPTGSVLELLLTSATDNIDDMTAGDVTVEVWYRLLGDV